MKKLVSLVAALTVATTSLGAFAAFYENPEAFTGEKSVYGVPITDTVDAKLDMKLAQSGNAPYTKNLSLSKVKEVNIDSDATLDMTNVAKEWNAFLDAAVARAKGMNPDADEDKVRANAIANTKLTGEYIIKITVNENANSDAAILTPSDAVKAADGSGWTWSDETNKFFEQTSAAYDEQNKVITINMKLKDYEGINADLDAYFNPAAAEGATATPTPVPLKLTINNTNVKTEATATYYDAKAVISGDFSGNVKITPPGAETSTVNFASKDDESVNLYNRRSSSGGGGGGSRTTPQPTTTDAPTDAPTTVPSDVPTTPSVTPTPVPDPQQGGNGKVKLDYDNHYAYIIGYPAEPGHEDELTEVRPNNNITRAEVATIFFRMLEDDSRAEYWTQDNEFSDVSIDEWFNNAISTAANADIVNGYPDGTFRPNAPITRAEFAAIAARFTSLVHEGDDLFSDISTHWARAAINNAAKTGWVNGYEDGTFMPDQYIRRSEAMTLVNRVLYRLVDSNGVALNAEAKMEWIDNLDTSAWYYAAVQEATNSHDYDRTALGAYETWKAIVAPRDWEALEKSYSKVTDAGSEESVAKDLLESAATAEPETTDAPETTDEPETTETPEATEAPAAE